jgi:hypothetical protein
MRVRMEIVALSKCISELYVDVKVILTLKLWVGGICNLLQDLVVYEISVTKLI